MKKFLKYCLIIFALIFIPLGLTACSEEDEVQVRVDNEYVQWSKDGSTWTNIISVEDIKEMLGETYKGDTGAQGVAGVNGREVEFNKSETHLQWRYVGDSAWTNLIALDDVKGEDGTSGTNGTDGREVEFNVSSTHIQWRYVGDSAWTNLIDFNALKGADGEDGEDGTTPTITISDDGYWVINGEKTTTKATGASEVAGTDWHKSEGEPVTDLGEEGDFYLDTESLKLYSKAETEWVYVANFVSSDLILGDVNGNKVVDEQDAIYLLRHVMMPDRYPLSEGVEADFNSDDIINTDDALVLQAYIKGKIEELPYTGEIPDDDYATIVDVDYDNNGKVEEADALYLLRHVMMPDNYPVDDTKTTDVNEDGAKNVDDALVVLYYSVGAIKYLPYTKELPTIQKGDLNLDGDIGLKDLQILRNHVTGTEEIEFNFIINNADLDENGEVTYKDCYILEAYLKGTISSLPYTEELPNDNYKVLIDVDYNNSGTVDGDDALYLLRYVMMPDRYPVEDTKTTDVNEDGATNVDDALLIMHYASGLVKYLPYSGIIPTIQTGDLNFDERVDVKDLQILRNHVTGTETIAFDYILDYADLNNDGVVGYTDCFILEAYLNGAIDTIPYTGELPNDNYKVLIDVDYNNSGTVDGDDALYLLRYVMMPDRYPIDSSKTTDVNEDGVTDIDDALMVMYYAAGYVKYLPYAGELPTIQKGDLNFDERIDVEDLKILRNHVAGTETIEFDFIRDNADFNGDDALTDEDVAILKQYLNGEDVTLE